MVDGLTRNDGAVNGGRELARWRTRHMNQPSYRRIPGPATRRLALWSGRAGGNASREGVVDEWSPSSIIRAVYG